MSSWFDRFGYAEVADGLLIGAYPLDARDVTRLTEERVEVLYNLCSDEEYPPGTRLRLEHMLGATQVREVRLPLVDYGNLPAETLDRAVDQILGELDVGRRVYLHCRAGMQRSAAVAAGVVALREGLEIEPALDAVRGRKPSADPLEHQREDLLAWWQGRPR